MASRIWVGCSSLNSGCGAFFVSCGFCCGIVRHKHPKAVVEAKASTGRGDSRSLKELEEREAMMSAEIDRFTSHLFCSQMGLGCCSAGVRDV